MNRQERRRLAKQSETEAKHLKYLEARNQHRTDAMLNFYAASIIMAHHKYYGANADDKIEGFLRAWNDEIVRIHGGSPDDYLQYLTEIREKTGITFEITD